MLVGGVVLDLVHRAQFTARTRNVPYDIVHNRLIVLHCVVALVSLLLRRHCLSVILYYHFIYINRTSKIFIN